MSNSVGASPPLKRKKRLAIIAYGILNHSRGAQPEPKWPSLSNHKHIAPHPNISLHVSVSSLNRHVVAPALQHGYEVDTFVHCWDVQHTDTILNLYNPTSYLIEEREGAFKSIEAGLEVRRAHEQKHALTYDWVFVFRHDMFFRTDFDFNALNRSIFYVANWCYPTGEKSTELTAAGLLQCSAIERFQHDVLEGIPDFWFLGSPQDMDRVFLNFTQDFERGAFNKTNSLCAHAKVGGRIFGLHDKGIINVGRYLVHHMDYNLYRWIDPKREWIFEQGLTWKDPNSYDLMESHRASVCVGTYCEFTSPSSTE